VLQGRIVDEEGHALPGATIQVKNSREVYITNSDGYFSFSTTQPGAAVQISLAGYYDATQQLQPGAAPTHTLQRLPGTRIKRSGRNAGKITAVGKAAE
jgi:protocatechuate 3,4-dioxygenase beta subunit